MYLFRKRPMCVYFGPELQIVRIQVKVFLFHFVLFAETLVIRFWMFLLCVLGLPN